jgi:hypothetical protein
MAKACSIAISHRSQPGTRQKATRTPRRQMRMLAVRDVVTDNAVLSRDAVRWVTMRRSCRLYCTVGVHGGWAGTMLVAVRRVRRTRVAAECGRRDSLGPAIGCRAGVRVRRRDRPDPVHLPVCSAVGGEGVARCRSHLCRRSARRHMSPAGAAGRVRRRRLSGPAYPCGDARHLAAEGLQRPTVGTGGRIHAGDRRPGHRRGRRKDVPRHRPCR